jgi:hypothetical protein
MPSQSQPSGARRIKPARITLDLGTWLTRYVAVVVKNVVGYLLILCAIVVGGIFPGPLGTPMFLIGFAMITFPGKRKLTSGALRGIQIPLFSSKARVWRLAVSLLLPPGFIILLEFMRLPNLYPSRMSFTRLCGVYALAIVASWFLTLLAVLLLNAIIRILPHVRRKVRPWLRDHGVNLLPPRRKPRSHTSPPQPPDDQQIVEFSRPHISRGHAKS